ncbi:hypothetical protein Nepgr_024300 [Nepenthes gracilis]|uniref:Receptor-like serine/threonine-protein kinase n=1 Tax=Nepenthes gracilis TaxID=150966 RepID=A0AAD3T5R1_NEPGR|nr:hypothetical protein Nepgr_024300 [Nepenthes gracilis]
MSPILTSFVLLSSLFFTSIVFPVELNAYSLPSEPEFQQKRSAPSSSTYGRGTRTPDYPASLRSVILRANSTILSENRTFELGFFTPNHQLSNWYLGIWYASIPTPTYVWVANRRMPIKNITSAALEITAEGHLMLMDSVNFNVWETENAFSAAEMKLLETGNLVLISPSGERVWQSFDHPTDTWLPGMNLTREQSLTCWKSLWDPSPGKYLLRLKTPGYGEFELVYNGTIVAPYWATGNWTGAAFTNVPEMTVPYIYKFHFTRPFTPTASFGFTETSLDSEMRPPLTRFHVDFAGQLRQYTWSPQTENWNMFWSQPENRCRVYGLCGNMGLCYGAGGTLPSKLCRCIDGFEPADEFEWESGDFSRGCRRIGSGVCDEKDAFVEVGAVSFDEAQALSFQESSRSVCERSCLANCSCIGFYLYERLNSCKILYGRVINLKNLTTDSTMDENLYLRVGRNTPTKMNHWDRQNLLIATAVCGFVIFSSFIALFLLILRRSITKMKKKDEAALSVTNLKVFSYKELHAATRGFSEKLGHGGFGTVFQGVLSDSSPVAVKRLERLGGGEREFRAELCTIGNVQHVNLVRLRGFCSENSHRLLVYEYMPNGPLSGYLKRDGQNLSWDVRFRVAIGTAKALAYLHDECRDCIIHCDIKPENILLDYDYAAKVSDFGLARLIGREFSRVLATMRGTWGYVAPEWISGVAITSKADVYSYGMTLLELISGRRNVDAPPPDAGCRRVDDGAVEGGGEDKWFFPPWAARQIISGNVAAVIDPRLGSDYNSAEAERVTMAAVWCIQDEEAARPTMGMVVKMLEGIVEVTVPPPPKLLQALVSGESFPGVVVDSGNGLSSRSVCSDDCARVSKDSASSPGHASLPTNPNL